MNFNEEEISKLIRQIYIGKITPNTPPQWLYDDIDDFLQGGVKIGFGVGVENSAMLRELSDNIRYFSAAKTFNQTLVYADAIFDPKGYRVPFEDYKKEVFEAFGEYNKTWLETEYKTAVSQAQMAQLWDDIQRDKDIRPILTYRTTEDKRVCPICAPLDGFTAYADDKIWAKIFPINHYNCLCTVTQELEGTPISPKDPSIRTIPEEFRFNVGMVKEVFPLTHPYFNVPKKYENLKENNFNLKT